MDRLKLVRAMLNASKVAFLVVESYFYENHEPLNFDLVFLECHFPQIKVGDVRPHSNRDYREFILVFCQKLFESQRVLVVRDYRGHFWQISRGRI